jgi:hypothetical protein
VEEVHKNEMESAYKKATEEYMALHPEAKDIEMKYDPKKLLESLEKERLDKAAKLVANNAAARQQIVGGCKFA